MRNTTGLNAALAWISRLGFLLLIVFFFRWFQLHNGPTANAIDELARTPLSDIILFVAYCTVLRLMCAPSIASTPIQKRTALYSFDRIENESLDAVIYAAVFVFLIIRPFCIQAFKIPSESMLETLQVNDFIVANKAVYRYSDPKVGDIVVFRPPAWACTPDQVDLNTGEVNVDFIKRCQGVPGDVVEVRNGTLYRNGQAITEPYVRDRMNNDFKLVKYRDQTNDASWKSWLPNADPGLPDNESHRFLASLWPKIAAVTHKELFEYWPVVISGEGVNQAESYTAAPFHVGQTDNKLADHLRDLPPAPVPPGYYLMMGDNRNGSFDGRAWGLVPRDDIIGRSWFIWYPVSRWRQTK